MSLGSVLLWLTVAACSAPPTADMPGGAPTPVATPATPEPPPTPASDGAAPGGAAPATPPAVAEAVPSGPTLTLSTTGTGTPIRIGWQTSWATQGQLVSVLVHTDILEKNGFVGEFKGFAYGAPLNEGALAGAVDALFTADQPALSLAAKVPAWGIVGRLMYNRVGLFVPSTSPVKSAKDLKIGRAHV